MSVVETLQIDASPARVWQLLDDPRQLSLWIPEVVETTYPNGRPKEGSVGIVFVQSVNERGKIKSYNGEITAFTAGKQLGIRLADDTVIIDALYSIARDGAGTRLDFVGDVRARSPLMNMMMTLAWPITRSLMLQQINKLKEVAEQPVDKKAAAAAIPSAPRKITKAKVKAPKAAKATTKAKTRSKPGKSAR